MLALKLGMSLVSSNRVGGWSPDDESSLEAWYKKGTGIILNGSDVARWGDSSSNSYTMVQATATEQPAYDAGTSELVFVEGDVNNLQSASDIELTAEFTVGIRLAPTKSNVSVLASNSLANEFFKISTSSILRVKIDGTQVEITLDSGSFVGDYYLVITRDSSNLLTLYKNGVAQADTETLAGTANIDAIGVRRTDLNPFDGTIKEIQIYSSESTDLTANVNARLSGL